MDKKILICTGGTGGHLFPAQAFARELCQNYMAEILFVGGKLSENKWFNKELYAYQDVSCATLSLSQGLKIFNNGFSIVKGIVQSCQIIKRFDPDLIIAFGSYHTLPILIAAAFSKKIIFLHEQNKYMGKVNRFFAKRANKVMVSFPKTMPFTAKEYHHVKMPLKFDSKILPSKLEARKQLNLDPKLKTILVCGGSQGAMSINRFFLNSLKYLKDYAFQVIHLIGYKEDLERVQACYQEHHVPAYVKAFDENIHLLMRSADFMIARAGASTIAEILELEIPAILIPYPYAGGHQEHNADFLEIEVGGGLKLPEGLLSKELLAKSIVSFFNNENIEQYVHHIQNHKMMTKVNDFSKLVASELNLYGK